MDPLERAKRAAARTSAKDAAGVDEPVTAKDTDGVEGGAPAAERELRTAAARPRPEHDPTDYEREMRARREKMFKDAPDMPPLPATQGVSTDTSADAASRALQEQAAAEGRTVVTREGSEPGDSSPGTTIERHEGGPTRKGPWSRPREPGRSPIVTDLGRAG